jgi:hypothetical protein
MTRFFKKIPICVSHENKFKNNVANFEKRNVHAYRHFIFQNAPARFYTMRVYLQIHYENSQRFSQTSWNQNKSVHHSNQKNNYNLDLKFSLRTGIRQSNKVIVPKFPPSPLLPTHKKKRVALVRLPIVCMEILFLKLARNRVGTHWEPEKI